MQVKYIIQRLKETKVLENYSFMTILNIFSALLSLVIYPYVIRMTGKEAYGTYAYALAIAVYFQIIIDFGFHSPSAKAIVGAKDDIKRRGEILSAVLTAKTLLFVVCSIVFGIMVYFVPFMRENSLMTIICYVQVFVASLYPVWYFQGMKNMKRVTIINLLWRLSSVPFIFLFVHSADDMIWYALITMLSLAAGTATALISIRREGVRIKVASLKTLKPYFKESTPFFLTDLAGNIKSSVMKTIIKNMFGVGEVAVYDLADKIVSIPRLFTQNINGALFPEVVDKATPKRVRHILNYERLIGGAFTLIIVLLSYPTVLLLGGKAMAEAVPLAMILSMTIYSWLVVGGYLYMVFVPINRYYNITVNQIVSLISCLVIAGAGLLLWKNIIVVAFAISLSGFAEILYCRYIAKKYHLL